MSLSAATFFRAQSFNQPINFNTSRVTDMECKCARAKGSLFPNCFLTPVVHTYPLAIHYCPSGSHLRMLLCGGPLTCGLLSENGRSASFVRISFVMRSLVDPCASTVMFREAYAFNQSLSLDTRRVTSMRGECIRVLCMLSSPLSRSTLHWRLARCHYP